MKKTTLFIVIAIVFLTACQSNPTKETIVSKNDGKLQKIINNTDEDEKPYYVPDRWKEAISLKYFDCTINADIKMPQTSKFIVQRVKTREFALTEVQNVSKYLTKDSLGIREYGLSREDLMEELMWTKRGLPTWNDDGSFSYEPYEGQQQTIEQIEKEIEGTSKTFEYVLPEDYFFEKEFMCVCKFKDNYSVDFQVYSSAIYFYPSRKIPQPERWVLAGEAFIGEPKGTTLKNVKISEEQAKEIASNVINDLSINNIGYVYGEKARILSNNNTTFCEGWMLYYSRNDGGMLPVYNFNASAYGDMQFSSEEYIANHHMEYVCFFVDETGIRCFEWSYPLEIIEIVNENVALLPFEQIQEKIRQYIKFGLSWADVKDYNIYNIPEIYNITLSSSLIPIKDNFEESMMVPTWYVYYKNFTEGTSDEISYILCINALDGSRIDAAPLETPN